MRSEGWKWWQRWCRHVGIQLRRKGDETEGKRTHGNIRGVCRSTGSTCRTFLLFGSQPSTISSVALRSLCEDGERQCHLFICLFLIFSTPPVSKPIELPPIASFPFSAPRPGFSDTKRASNCARPAFALHKPGFVHRHPRIKRQIQR